MHKKTVFGAIAATAIAPLMLATPAFASPAPNVGPGDGIRAQVSLADGEDLTAACSINSTGSDQHGNRYAMTAGHCFTGTLTAEDVGQEFEYDNVVYDTEGNRIGEYVLHRADVMEESWGAGTRDYALIKLDEGVETHTYAHATPTQEINAISSTMVPGEAPAQEISGIVAFDSQDNMLRYSGLDLSKDGGTSGRTHGKVMFVDDDFIYAWTLAAPGDSGGIGHIDGANAGITSGGNSFIPISLYERTDNAIADIDEQHGIEYTQDGGGHYVDAPVGPIGQMTDQALDAAEKFDEAIANGSSSSAAANYTPATDAVNQAVDNTTQVVQDTAETVIDADQRAVSAVYGGTEQYVQENYANEYNQLANVVPEDMVTEGFAQADQALRTHLDVSAEEVVDYAAENAAE